MQNGISEDELNGRTEYPFRFDLHVHTVIGSPCAFYDPFDIPRYGEKEGLNGVVITDHNFGWEANGVTIEKYMGLGDAFKERGMTMLIGMEVSFREGDMLIYTEALGEFLGAIGRDIGRMDFEMDELLNIARDVGALTVLAHPHSYPETPPHAIERFNGLRGAFYNPYGIPEVAGSDAHFPWGVGAAFTLFPEEIKEMSDLIRQVLAGQSRPARKESRFE